MTQVRFTTQRIANTGLVLEEHLDHLGFVVDRFNWSVPAHLVPTFIDSRRRIVSIARLRQPPKPEIDFDFLKE